MRGLLAFLMALFAATASAQTVEPGDLRLELSFEERTGPLYTGEMVLLKVRGFYKIRIAREKLKQADLDGFDWMQLGEDIWSKDKSKGHEILQLERTIALFPNRAGVLEIKPFEHQLELWTRDGKRYDHTVESVPISIEVTERPDIEDWWLPARRITVEDRWSNAPDKLGTGGGALRVVTVTVEGVLPEQVPPMPELESAGAFVFPHPEMRIKRLYKRGPVTRVIWRWTVRPENPPSAYLKPIRLPYFDTRAREHREIVIAAQRIAMTDEAIATFLAEADESSVAAVNKTLVTKEGTVGGLRFSGLATPLGLVGGLLGGLALMMPSVRWRKRKPLGEIWRRWRPNADVRDLKRAVARGDAAVVRRAGIRLLNSGVGDASQMESAVGTFDRQMFGVSQNKPDLKTFAVTILNAHRSTQ